MTKNYINNIIVIYLKNNIKQMLTLNFFSTNKTNISRSNSESTINSTVQKERNRFSTRVSDGLENVFNIDNK